MGNTEDVDSLLAQFQAEYQPKKPDPTSSQSNSLLDDALARMKNDLKDGISKQTIDRDKSKNDNPAINNLLNDFKADLTAKKATIANTNLSFPKIKSPPPNNVNTDNLLKQIKAESQKQETIETKQLNKQNITEIQQRELNTQKQRRLNLQRAEAWLKDLDSNSEEWLWFEQFAYSYESKVEAAIDYLKALGKL
jgi:hypothetical protein